MACKYKCKSKTFERDHAIFITNIFLSGYRESRFKRNDLPYFALKIGSKQPFAHIGTYFVK